MLVRPATDRDLDAIATVAAAHGHGPVDTGRDPAYINHLMAYGRVRVACDPAGLVYGFAAALPVGDTMMLADLFVAPDAQSAGAGAAMLSSVLDGSPARMTFSSHDPRAIALYTRAGMTARWALLYLVGPGGTASGGSPVSAERAGDWESRWHGVDRTSTYRHWSVRGGDPVLIGDPAAPTAVAARNAPGVLAHVAVAPSAPAAEAVLDAVEATGATRLYLPSTHPALETLLRRRFTIEDFDLFMTSGREMPGGATGAYEPGLC